MDFTLRYNYLKNKSSDRVTSYSKYENKRKCLHYYYIKKICHIVAYSHPVTSRNDAIYICDSCLIYFNSREALVGHRFSDCTHVRTNLPNTGLSKKNWRGKNVSRDKIKFEGPGK